MKQRFTDFGIKTTPQSKLYTTSDLSLLQILSKISFMDFPSYS